MSQILTPEAEAVEACFRNKNVDPRPGWTWQESLKHSIRSGRELVEALGLPFDLASKAAEADFPVFAPLEYVSRMQLGRPDDPLLLQVLGTKDETDAASGLLDPVGDSQSTLVPGLLKKYAGRALMIASGACAVHCRYCFRRHFPYSDVPAGRSRWQPALDAISADQSIAEVILSGGDPLSLRDTALQRLIDSLGSMAHVQRIRVHTRFPVMIPQRVCQSLLTWVASSRCAVYFVLHFNHAAEVDQHVVDAMHKLKRAGAMLLNQSVLLKGVNDSEAAQRDLCQRLIDIPVLPYYLHQLDHVRGAMHFQVSDDRAREIIAALRKDLPGYGVPQLVREIAGQPHKVPL